MKKEIKEKIIKYRYFVLPIDIPCDRVIYEVYEGKGTRETRTTYSAMEIDIKKLLSQEKQKLVEEIEKILNDYRIKEEPLCEQNILLNLLKTKIKIEMKRWVSPLKTTGTLKRQCHKNKVSCPPT